jgi:predicted ATPase with chaperone activity
MAKRGPLFVVGGDEKRRLALARQIFEIHQESEHPEAMLRTPHPTISDRGLFGEPLAGQVSEFDLASRGVLFLDAIETFNTSALRALAKRLQEPKAPILLLGSGASTKESKQAIALFSPVGGLEL